MIESEINNSLCFCGSHKPYKRCCELIIKDIKLAETSEELMRSRYSAYCKHEIDYLINSTHISQRHLYSYLDLKNWADRTQWQKLEIIKTKDGLKTNLSGEVEFKAYYIEDCIQKTHHELSFFKKEEGIWYFVSGKDPKSIQVPKNSEKIGRNDPCYCGSNKKYKKCCGLKI